MSEQDVYAAPKSDLGAPLIDDDPLASHGERLKAALVDGGISLVLLLPLLWCFWSLGYYDKTGAMLTDALLLSNLCNIAAMLAVHGYFWHMYGQSVGKRWIGIKIVDLRATSRRCGKLSCSGTG